MRSLNIKFIGGIITGMSKRGNHQNLLDASYVYDRNPRTQPPTLSRRSRQGESVTESGDGRREEILSTLRDDPLGGQRERCALVLRVRAHHTARANTVRPVVVLTNDGVEARRWHRWLRTSLGREGGVVRPTCYGDALANLNVRTVRELKLVRTLLDELEAVCDATAVRNEDEATAMRLSEKVRSLCADTKLTGRDASCHLTPPRG